jgi:acetylornithine/succinyldiaminopimelate/putrescine aminotransferase
VLNATGPSTLRFLPPLIVAEPEIDQVLRFLGEVL